MSVFTSKINDDNDSEMVSEIGLNVENSFVMGRWWKSVKTSDEMMMMINDDEDNDDDDVVERLT